VSDDDLAAIVGKLVELGSGGDLSAIRLLFKYMFTKPAEPRHPSQGETAGFDAARGNAKKEATVSAPPKPAVATPHYVTLRDVGRINHDLVADIKAQIQATVNKREKPAQSKPEGVSPTAPFVESETLRLIDLPDANTFRP
jgi:hypothetical protein